MIRLLAKTALLTSSCLGLACSQGSAAPVQVAFDGSRAWAHLERIVAFGERPSGTAALGRLREYLAAELKTLGCEPVIEAFTARTPVGEIAFANLYVDIPPPGEPLKADGPMVIIASHFDTKRMTFRFVGANDGGSSTAVLLELARVLQGSTVPRSVTYRLLFLDGEEAIRMQWAGDDNTYGSRNHVKTLTASGELARVKAFVLLDMVGDKRLRLTTDLNSNRELLALFFDTAGSIGLKNHVAGPRKTVLDDHIHFTKAGVPSVDLIDLEYGPMNERWHTHVDTLENCSEQSLLIIGTIVTAGLPHLEKWVTARIEAAQR